LLAENVVINEQENYKKTGIDIRRTSSV